MCPSVGIFVPGPMEPATKRGEPSAPKSAATSLAMRAAATLISCARSARPYSARGVAKAPKVAVSVTSQPTAK